MKFMPNRDLDIVTSALNFSTPDLHIVGGCDLYTTKAAGGDKKLYKNIENGLEAQYQAKLNLSYSLSPPQAKLMAPSLNLSRSSPFGNLDKISSRRTYAYLIATLNASHPDYDFSHTLRPTDFKREKSLRAVINNIDSTLYNLRPRPMNSYLVPGLKPGSVAPPPGQMGWGPAMWGLIDQQMSLKECNIYRYAPDLDPFEDDEDGTIWSVNYFFFNKARKRVCYLYLRGISALTHDDKDGLMTPIKTKRLADDESDGWLTPDLGARKRARYWLGNRDGVEVADPDYEPGTAVLGAPIGVPTTSEERSDEEIFGPPPRPVVDENHNYLLSDEETRSVRSVSKSTMRGTSEEVVGPMELGV
ncbi:uncharacterized protein HMPREF1541_02698 [Cyphellophora europaea CBS 101466]|uniref:Repressor of RNA polymerase III transcription MAF1 n=1 Tax=Cyphellophora europaea (strain CBS 101466) TaxID=1220924 RepID=W2S6I6_CYPE1|nr:uncharacterized protein HMPREF1541_02698 [Cyphellophora europaea CBS 101466]ETN43539.1 hypothetical protein HMPREF1541_02698 [Cyphellophora europaea CBS 101466]